MKAKERNYRILSFVNSIAVWLKRHMILVIWAVLGLVLLLNSSLSQDNSKDLMHLYAIDGDITSIRKQSTTISLPDIWAPRGNAYYALGWATDAETELHTNDVLKAEWLEDAEHLASAVPDEKASQMALQICACLRLEYALTEYDHFFTSDAAEAIGDALAGLERCLSDQDDFIGEEVYQELCNELEIDTTSSQTPMKEISKARLKIFQDRVSYLKTCGYYHLAKLYNWQQNGGWFEVVPANTKDDKMNYQWPDSLDEKVLGKPEDYIIRYEKELKNWDDIIENEKDNSELTLNSLITFLNRTEEPSKPNEDDVFRNRYYPRKDEQHASEDKETTEYLKKWYQRQRYYWNGCYHWFLTCGMNKQVTVEENDEALENWIKAAKMGDGKAALRLSEISFYGIERYHTPQENSVVSLKHDAFKNMDGDNAKDKNKDKDENPYNSAGLLAQWAAEKADEPQPHGYTVLARIADKSKGKKYLGEKPKDWIKKATTCGDSYGEVMFYILNLDPNEGKEDHSKEEKQFNDLIESSRQDQPYAKANIGTYYYNRGNIDLMIQYRQEALEMGCEVAAFRLAQYYKDEGDLARMERYQNLAKLVRDINYRECMSMK